ncbi:MAG: toll/interleukin-1 receptor domain-containing protein [Desulfobacterales bacterium]|nr:toll/interleukin-1 receptor domain-containing protein [Desulfobacterales bacterium]
MNPEKDIYRRLLNFALETDIGFSLLIVQSDNYDLQSQWRDRLAIDLSHHRIKLVAIEGKDLPTGIGKKSITPNIQKHIPKSGPWVLSLSHFEGHTRPVIQSLSEKSQTGYIGAALQPAPLITRLNVERDALVQAFPVPFILWCSSGTVRQLAEFAPDFYDIRDSVLDLPKSGESSVTPLQTELHSPLNRNKVYDVFISHKSEYKPWVEVLARNLKNRGYSVFLDSWELAPSKSIADELYRGLKQSRKGILMVTPEAIESGWVREEYDQMMVRQKKDPDFSIIPVIFGKEVTHFPFLRNIQWLDFRNPKTYRKAFYLLLCAIQNRKPDPNYNFEDELIIPAVLKEETGQPAEWQLPFVEELFELFYRKQAVLLLAQADRGQSAMNSCLLKRAERLFGKENVLHLVPPYSPHTDMKNYFSVIGQQCNFSEVISDSAALTRAFENRLTQSRRLFVLVNGFENSCEEGREELAGVFRDLNERYYQNLRILICGGEKLADLYFVGTLSFLNHAEVREWPELNVNDICLIIEQSCSGRNISEKEAEELLNVSGGHPRLLEQCLDFLNSDACFDSDACQNALMQSPFVWQLFTPFVQDTVITKRLCQLLEQDQVGYAQPYLFDPLLRRLYWKNLLKRSSDGKRLVWRCEALQAAGRQILSLSG